MCCILCFASHVSDIFWWKSGASGMWSKTGCGSWQSQILNFQCFFNLENLKAGCCYFKNFSSCLFKSVSVSLEPNPRSWCKCSLAGWEIKCKKCSLPLQTLWNLRLVLASGFLNSKSLYHSNPGKVTRRFFKGMESRKLFLRWKSRAFSLALEEVLKVDNIQWPLFLSSVVLLVAWFNLPVASWMP